MRKMDLLVRAAFGAAVLSFAGTALAAGPQTSLPVQLAQAQPEAPPPTEPPAAQPPAGEQPGGAQMDIQEGMEVVNAEGQKVGEVKAIEGDQIIVSVGEFLGIGERDVALTKDQLQPTGSGPDAKLQTSMTQQELEQLPPYEGSAPGGGGAPSEAPPPSESAPPPSEGGGGGGEGGGGG